MPKCMTNEEIINKFSDPDALKKVYKLWGEPKEAKRKKSYYKNPKSS